MAKGLSDNTLDATLAELATCDRLDISSDVNPVDLTGSLANVTLTPGDGNGDYTIEDDPTSGRRLVVAAQSGIDTTAAGTPATAILSLGGVIKGFTSVSGSALTFPGVTNISTFNLRGADPV